MSNAPNKKPRCIKAEQQTDVRLEGAVACKCQFDVQQFSPALFDEFLIDKPQSILSAVDKRQCEFFVGRYCATKALAILSVFRQQIPIGSHRSPVWPAGIVGSISHNENIALCIVGRKQLFRGLGVDIETWIALPTAQTIRTSVLNPCENHWLSCEKLPMTKILTLLFSAKESFFKAAYPLVQAFFDFSAASIVGIDWELQTFSLRLEKNLTSQFKKGCIYEGSYHLNQDNAITYIAV